MKKLIKGIVEFRQKFRDDYQESFSRLALEQSPDALFVACSDSRVVPNTFASTNPGDLFVARNVGNLIPPCPVHGGKAPVDGEAAAAALEFSVLNLKVSDIIICGHSDCGAMKTLLAGRNLVETPYLREWLRHGDMALENLQKGQAPDPGITISNQLSQLNVLVQMEHVKSYPFVRKRLEEGSLGLHGWWFDLAKADVYIYEENSRSFVLIDESWARKNLNLK